MLPWDPILARLMRCRMTRRLTILALSRERRESQLQCTETAARRSSVCSALLCLLPI
jgi:hypothetical protein